MASGSGRVDGMATTAAAVSRRLQARWIAEAFRNTAEEFPDRVAVRTKDDEVALTWAELRDRVDALAGGLAKLGMTKGDTVGLMFSNRPEFHIADLAVMTLGATPFSLYSTLSPDQIQYVMQDAGAKIALIEEGHFEQVDGARRLGLEDLETIVVLEGAKDEGTVAWDDVEGSDPN